MSNAMLLEQATVERMINNVAVEIAGRGLDETQISERIRGLLQEQGQFIVGVFERARVFNYSQPLEQVDADCKVSLEPDFPTFHHTDWVDGESVVQAEQTTFEDGFNLRFHRIEDDLAALSAELAKAYACIAELRAALFTTLNDARAELNRINQEVYDLRGRPERPDRFTIPDAFAIPGVVGDWVGNTVVNEKEFLVYETAGRYSLIPKVDLPVTRFVRPLGPLDFNDRLRRPGELTRWMETDEEVRHWVEDQGQGFRVDELVAKFGDRVINEGSGLTVATAVSSLPLESVIRSRDELVDTVMNLESAAVRGSAGLNRLFGSLNIANRDEVAAVDVVKLPAVTPEVSRALTDQGLDTVGAVANLQGPELVAALNQAGVVVDQGVAAGLVANARMLLRIGGR